LLLAARGARPAIAAPGDLDPGFGNAGLFSLSGGNTQALEGRGIALQKDGKVVVAGRFRSSDGDENFAVSRLNPDGSPDLTFGSTLIARLILPGHQEAHAVAIQKDGKIVLAGFAEDAGGADFMVARFNPNATPDTTFDQDGFVVSGVSPGSMDLALAVAVQKDGKIVTAGFSDASGSLDFALMRFDTNGRLDRSFDGDGRVITDFGSAQLDLASAVAIQRDGRIVAGGTTAAGAEALQSEGEVAGGGPSPQNFALARYLPNGRLDRQFDGDGRVITDFLVPGTADRIRSLAIQKNGRIVVAGETENEAGSDFALARYRPNGALDRTFGLGVVAPRGQVLVDFGPGYSRATAVLVQRDGKVVAAGPGYSGVTLDFALARLLPDGTPDSGFGTSGRKLTDFGGTEHLGAAALQKDGKLVAAGTLGSGLGSVLLAARFLMP
jgi:uncharacterized delta-60 repeat protein